MQVLLIFTLTVVVLALAGCGKAGDLGEAPRRTLSALDLPSTPALYTDANAADVWLHPVSHLGASVELAGTVQIVARLHQGTLVVLAVPGAPGLVAAHVFDRRFRPPRGSEIQIVGIVRGPLGSGEVPGVPVIAPLTEGTPVIDARAASVA